jgi:rhodanese-related sulfurtransferase
MFAMLMGLKSISPGALHERMQQEALTVYDVNARESWLKARVPSAIHLVPAYEPAALPQDRTARLVFYCSNPLCRKAPSAAKRAKALGYSDVQVMSAGIVGWLEAGLPVERGA